MRNSPTLRTVNKDNVNLNFRFPGFADDLILFAGNIQEIKQFIEPLQEIEIVLEITQKEVQDSIIKFYHSKRFSPHS